MGGDTPAGDPRSLIRTRQFRVMLVFAATIGLLVSAVSWGYLELVHYIQNWVYKDLPNDLGYTALTPGDLGHSTIPWWYPLPWLALAGVLTAFAITRLPGDGNSCNSSSYTSCSKRRQHLSRPHRPEIFDGSSVDF